MRFQERLQSFDEPPVLYEVIPPHASATEEEVLDTAQYLETLLIEHAPCAINIPEIRNESRGGARVSNYMSKMDPRDFGDVLRDTFGPGVDIIVNHPTVYEPGADFERWLAETVQDHGTYNVVLVGGESSEVDYPGPGPVEAARIADKLLPEIAPAHTLGGITIPNRRRDGPRDEPDRLLEKQRAGIDFFTSQVIYAAEPTKALMRDYARVLDEADAEPAPIFLSFAPISGRKDARFLEWLGVTIPDHTREWIMAKPGEALDRSVRVAEHVLRDVVDYMHRREIEVPIGLNIEHVMRYNHEASEVLMDRLVSLMEWRAG